MLVKLGELETKRMTKEMKYLVSSLTYLAWPQKGNTDYRFFSPTGTTCGTRDKYQVLIARLEPLLSYNL